MPIQGPRANQKKHQNQASFGRKVFLSEPGARFSVSNTEFEGGGGVRSNGDRTFWIK